MLVAALATSQEGGGEVKVRGAGVVRSPPRHFFAPHAPLKADKSVASDPPDRTFFTEFGARCAGRIGETSVAVSTTLHIAKAADNFVITLQVHRRRGLWPS